MAEQPPLQLLEVTLGRPDDFLRAKETLERIGIPSSTGTTTPPTLTQTCHLLHKRGRYYCTHFKELFALDNKPLLTLTEHDLQRRNTIAVLLDDWGIWSIADRAQLSAQGFVAASEIKVIRHKDRSKWKLLAKYALGKQNPK